MALQLDDTFDIDNLIDALGSLHVESTSSTSQGTQTAPPNLAPSSSAPPTSASTSAPVDLSCHTDFLEGIGGLKFLDAIAFGLFEMITINHYAATATPGVYIKVCIVPDLADMSWHLMRISALQIIDEILQPMFRCKPKRDPAKFWELLGAEHEWQFMTYDEICQATKQGVRLWAQTLTLLAVKLKQNKEALSNVHREFDRRFTHLYTMLKQDDKEVEQEDLLPIFTFFEGVVQLVSDLSYTFDHPMPRLKDLHSLPAREVVLNDIVAQVPAEEELLDYVADLLADLSDDHTCFICTTSWDELQQDQGFAHRAGGEWCAVNNNGERILIKPGYENVPVKVCEHVMCIGCLKTWLDGPGRLQCPYRDHEYGVHRDQAVTEVEELGELFGITDGF